MIDVCDVTRRASLAAALLIALSMAGCSLLHASRRGSESWNTGVDAALQPQLERVRAALAASSGRAVGTGDPDWQRFAAAYGLTVNYSVDPVDPAALSDAAITAVPAAPAAGTPLAPLVEQAIVAMLAAQDPRNNYLDPEIYRELRTDTRGQSAAGLEITVRDGVMTIVAPIEGSPAARAGLRPCDQLLAIDDMPTAGAGLVRTVQRLRGPAGSQVRLTVRRAGVPSDVTYVVTREVFRMRPVTSARLSATVGYIRLSQFNGQTTTDLLSALSELQRGGALDGLVLDLRNNPGGLLSQTIKVADVFLDAGVIVQTKGPYRDETFTARGGTQWGAIPLVILVNQGTAAGAEILAAALRDHGRAVLVGPPTFGRGDIQTIIPLGDDAALRLTTARAFTPTGAAIDQRLQPDVAAAADPADGLPGAADPIVAIAVPLLAAPLRPR